MFTSPHPAVKLTGNETQLSRLVLTYTVSRLCSGSSCRFWVLSSTFNAQPRYLKWTQWKGFCFEEKSALIDFQLSHLVRYLQLSVISNLRYWRYQLPVQPKYTYNVNVNGIQIILTPLRLLLSVSCCLLCNAMYHHHLRWGESTSFIPWPYRAWQVSAESEDCQDCGSLWPDRTMFSWFW